MENNELFQTIEQLKNTLSGINSARQQVEDTIASNKSIADGFQNASKSFDDLSNGVRKLMDSANDERLESLANLKASVKNLSKTCDAIIENLTKKCANSTGKLSSACDEIVASFGGQCKESTKDLSTRIKSLKANIDWLSNFQTSLTNAVSQINALNDGINALAQNLETSQRSQDTAIQKIQSSLPGVDAAITKAEASLSKKGDATAAVLGDKLEEISTGFQTAIDGMETKLNQRMDAISGEEIKLGKKMNVVVALAVVNVVLVIAILIGLI